jgi:hypothetical protein
MANGTQTIDYGALAKQAGAISSLPGQQAGNVDYTALAKQSGAISSQPSGGGASGSWDEPSTMQKVISGAEDVGIGALKGAGHTLAGLSPLLNKIPYIGETLAPSAGINAWNQITKPSGTAQNVGYGGEQVGEFLIPGGAEEKGAATLAEHLPLLGRFAAPAAKIAAAGLSTAAVSKMQGGSFTGGAMMGAGAGALGQAAQAVAPSIAESALGVTRKMRAYGKTPGAAALEEIGGIAPGTIAENAQQKLSQLTSELEQRAAASTVPASTTPALQVIDDEIAKATQRNSKTRYDMLQDLRNQLTTEFSTGHPIPTQVSASKILDLKRGIGDLETSWNPEVRSGIKPVIRKVYNALDSELDGAVPGSDELNQRISSLIPVAQRAESADRGAEIGQRIAHRVAAHTGALAGSGAGSYYGYKEGGLPGAIAGGAAGLVVPEVLASTPFQMGAARAMASPAVPRVAAGAGAQFLQRKRFKTNNDLYDDETLNQWKQDHGHL